MKLLARDAESLTFELDRRERELIVFLLQRYPVRNPADAQIASPADREAMAEEQRMLTEGLTAEQQENRLKVTEFIRTRLTPPPGRERSAAGGPATPARSLHPLRVTLVEVDWLLRVVNDVRVGCWERLGRPDEMRMNPELLGAAHITDFTAMELGGLVQSLLLHALEE
jgi:hypothetical protein